MMRKEGMGGGSLVAAQVTLGREQHVGVQILLYRSGNDGSCTDGVDLWRIRSIFVEYLSNFLLSLIHNDAR